LLIRKGAASQLAEKTRQFEKRICVILSGSEEPVLEGNCSAALKEHEKRSVSCDQSPEAMNLVYIRAQLVLEVSLRAEGTSAVPYVMKIHPALAAEVPFFWRKRIFQQPV
jgi:hypothetical protein